MIGVLHTSSYLGSQKRHSFTKFGIASCILRNYAVVRSHIARHAAPEAKRIDLTRWESTPAFAPGRVRISPINGQKHILWNHRVVPARHRVKRNVKPAFNRQILQLCQVFAPLPRTRECIFILDLNADHRASILPEQALKLTANLRIGLPRLRELDRIVRAYRALLQDPVRKSTISRLPMGPWANARVEHHSVVRAKHCELAQV